MLNSSDNLLYNLSYLSSVIHPVIILRLLEHRIFTPLFKKKSIPSNSKLPQVTTCFPRLSRPDVLMQKRSSFTKSNSKGIRVTPNTSITGATTNSSQLITNNELSLTMSNPTDFSLFFHSPTAMNSSNPSTRKWFWRNSERNNQVNTSSNRDPLLHSIVETDLGNSSGSVPLVVPNVAGVGEMKLFEKELLNLPSFQLSDSQNPLLPSPTCLNEDFPSQFNSTHLPLNQQNSTSSNDYETHRTNGLPKSNHDRRDMSSNSRIEIRRSLFV